MTARARLPLADVIQRAQRAESGVTDTRAWQLLMEHAVLFEGAQILRTDTTPKALFTMPKGADLLMALLFSATGSNAGTTARIAIGRNGDPTALLDPYDVRGAAGLGFRVLPIKYAGNIPQASVVTGAYAETGTPSTKGGPFRVGLLFTRF